MGKFTGEVIYDEPQTRAKPVVNPALVNALVPPMPVGAAPVSVTPNMNLSPQDQRAFNLSQQNRLAAEAIEKEKELKRVETLRANEQKQIAKDKITAERKRAALQKGIDIASITTTTALSIMKALAMTPPNPAMAILAGVTGAAQLAKAIATPLPQYAKGRDGGAAEMAIVGEAGTELLIKRDGTASLTPNRATITHLEAGEKVIPHNKLMQMIHNSAMVNLSDTKSITANDYANAYIQALEKNSGKIDKLIKVTENKNNNISISGNFEHYTKIKSILR